MILCRWSIARTKGRGDRGSPCLTPLLDSKSLPGKPFRRTDDVPEERMSFIQWFHFPRKPLATKISKMASCSTVSKALAKSNFRRIIFLLERWHWWRYSKAHVKKSCIDLPCRNPYWFLCITLRITFCSLMPSIKNFMAELSRDIGLKSLTFSGFCFLGTKVI